MIYWNDEDDWTKLSVHLFDIGCKYLIFVVVWLLFMYRIKYSTLAFASCLFLLKKKKFRRAETQNSCSFAMCKICFSKPIISQTQRLELAWPIYDKYLHRNFNFTRIYDNYLFYIIYRFVTQFFPKLGPHVCLFWWLWDSILNKGATTHFFYFSNSRRIIIISNFKLTRMTGAKNVFKPPTPRVL